MKLKIGVVIPTYDRIESLIKLLKQIYNQINTYPSIYVYVVIDNSNYHFFKIIKSSFPQALIIQGNGDWWWTKSVNEGCKLAKVDGMDSVLLLNDDITLKCNYFKTLIKVINNEPSSIIGSLSITQNMPQKIFFSGIKKIEWWHSKERHYHTKFRNYNQMLTGICPSVALPGRGLFIPLKVIERLGYFDEKKLPQYNADYDFVLRAGKNHIKTIISWDLVVFCKQEETGAGAPFLNQPINKFLRGFFSRYSHNSLLSNFSYHYKHCSVFILPISFMIHFIKRWYSFLKIKFQKK